MTRNEQMDYLSDYCDSDIYATYSQSDDQDWDDVFNAMDDWEDDEVEDLYDYVKELSK